jgi:hypothetical protein
MKTVTLIESELDTLTAVAGTEALETAAVGFVSPASLGRDPRFVVRHLVPVPDSAYLAREPDRLTLAPQFCMEVANRARALNCGVLFAHTHPNAYPDFSGTDDAGEKPLADYFGRRAVGHEHFALMVTSSVARGRRLGAREDVALQVVGSTSRRLTPTPESRPGTTTQSPARFERQVLALGSHGQAILSGLRVAIIGLGGTGSFVAQELAYLGVNDFILIDPDSVAASNLNRLLGATELDIGQPKVAVAARTIAKINTAARCEQVIGDVVEEDVVPRLFGADFLFSCTDSHASRAVLNQLAYQYLIPCIDMGIAIRVHKGTVTHITGRVQMLSPGLPCLICANWLDSNQVRIEMLTPEQRRQDAYLVGHSLPHPAVISLNGTVSSASVTMFLSAVAGFPSEARMLIYDAIRGALRPTVMTPDANCIVCCADGALARGERWALPIRTHAVG